VIPKKRYFIRLAYDGTNFCGWQNQKNGDSVQGSIEQALTTLFREKQAILGCGRTDTGVHADDYYAHWDYCGILDDKVVMKLNSILPRAIAIKEIFEVNNGENARFSASSRTYHYYLHTQKNPFRRLYSYEYLHQDLNIEIMQKATQLLLNYSEFLPLIKLDKEHKKTNCTLHHCCLNKIDDHVYRFEISANRFLHNMVRRIMGTLVLIGREKLSLEEFETSMNKQVEFRLIGLAPANGLHLVNVYYPFLNNK
jgi:tRNA pseudouridine38-40 synthase